MQAQSFADLPEPPGIVRHLDVACIQKRKGIVHCVRETWHAADMGAFAAAVCGVPEGSVTVGNLPQYAVWSVDAGYAAERSVAATADSGTDRANGTWLLDLALNLKSPVIYDPVPGDPDKRQVNPEAPLAAKEKQQRVRNRFR